MKVVIKSLKEMETFARAVAENLKGGEVLALVGELGAGKTAFTQALAKVLGVKETVQSPTFLLMKVYPIKLQSPISNLQSLCHVDAYRIKKESELVTIGLVEQMNDAQTVTVIEWADLVRGIIPARALWFKFAHGKNEDERVVTYA